MRVCVFESMCIISYVCMSRTERSWAQLRYYYTQTLSHSLLRWVETKSIYWIHFALRYSYAIHHSRLCFVGKQTQVTGLRQHYSVVSCSHFQSNTHTQTLWMFACLRVYHMLSFSLRREQLSIGVKELNRSICGRTRSLTNTISIPLNEISEEKKQTRESNEVDFDRESQRGGKMF